MSYLSRSDHGSWYMYKRTVEKSELESLTRVGRLMSRARCDLSFMPRAASHAVRPKPDLVQYVFSTYGNQYTGVLAMSYVIDGT